MCSPNWAWIEGYHFKEAVPDSLPSAEFVVPVMLISVLLGALVFVWMVKPNWHVRLIVSLATFVVVGMVVTLYFGSSSCGPFEATYPTTSDALQNIESSLTVSNVAWFYPNTTIDLSSTNLRFVCISDGCEVLGLDDEGRFARPSDYVFGSMFRCYGEDELIVAIRPTNATYDQVCDMRRVETT